MATPAHETARLLRLTVDEYLRMGEAGILRPGVRTELIDGEIVEMTPIGPGHAGVVNMLSNLMRDAVGGQAVVSTQNPVILSQHWAPEPDVALLKPAADWYRTAHATPADILLLVEVADSSSLYDLKTKLPGYAEAGVPEVWLVDLPGNTLTQFRNPAGDAFSIRMNLTDQLAAVRIPIESAAALDLSDLFAGT